MASPTLDLICCAFRQVDPSNWSKVYNDDAYPLTTGKPYHKEEEVLRLVYNICAILSSCLSILGAIYIFHPKKSYIPRQRQSLRAVLRQRNILTWLSVADVLACLGVLTISIANLAEVNLSHSEATENTSYKWTCIISTAWIQYFYVATYFWTFFYALDVNMMLRGNNRNVFRIYFVISWLFPAVMVFSGLIVMYASAKSTLECDPTFKEWKYLLPHYLMSYAPMLIVLIVNPILYWYSAKKVGPLLMRRGIYTDRERKIQSQVQNKFLLIVMVFTVCWLPNVINGCLLLISLINGEPVWYVFSTLSAIIWVATAIVNPLQAFLNAAIYWGPAGCTHNAPTEFTDADYSALNNWGSIASDSVDETSPLVRNSQGGIHVNT